MDTRRRQRPGQQRVEGTIAKSSMRREGSQIATEDEDVEHTHHRFQVGQELARVRVEGSVTQNMGDYNSVRVGVVIERPCLNTDESIRACYDETSRLVDEMVQTELDIATGGERA